jgi:lipopolysaccharide/colanic/teichoic acid biosynthesis glycosyltransferase
MEEMAANLEETGDTSRVGLTMPDLTADAPPSAGIPHQREAERRWRPSPEPAVDLAQPPLQRTAREWLALLVKDVLDRTFALAGLVCLLPILLLIGIAIRATSPGPALFRHVRVGRGGESFWMWKFRTMRSGAHDQLHDLLAEHGRDRSPLFKIPSDPRVTPLGQFLRRTSLDELPQLVNVLLGEMSLVGPRPQFEAEVALYAPHERQRLQVKPGVTGLWQVSGRSGLTWEQAVQYDLRYVREWSLILDAKILLRTVRAVLRREGAV